MFLTADYIVLFNTWSKYSSLVTEPSNHTTGRQRQSTIPIHGIIFLRTFSCIQPPHAACCSWSVSVILRMWRWYKPFLVCSYHSLKPEIWKRQPRLAYADLLASLLVGEGTWAPCGLKVLHFNFFLKTFHVVLILRFNLLKHFRMWLPSFLVKKFSLHSFRQALFLLLFKRERTAILQSLHHSDKRLCMCLFPGILGVKP